MRKKTKTVGKKAGKTTTKLPKKRSDTEDFLLKLERLMKDYDASIYASIKITIGNDVFDVSRVR